MNLANLKIRKSQDLDVRVLEISTDRVRIRQETRESRSFLRARDGLRGGRYDRRSFDVKVVARASE